MTPPRSALNLKSQNQDRLALIDVGLQFCDAPPLGPHADRPRVRGPNMIHYSWEDLVPAALKASLSRLDLSPDCAPGLVMLGGTQGLGHIIVNIAK